MGKLWNKSKLNNRGASLVMVIIAMAVVGILGAMILASSLSNFRMKSVDRKSKNNFYDAEVVVDELKSGLGDAVSQQLSSAYQSVLEDYANQNSSELYTKFDNLFIVGMKETLGTSTSIYGTGTDSYYQLPVSVLLDYLDTTKPDPASGKNNTVIEGDGGTNWIKVQTQVGSLVLKGIHVTYTDAEGYVSMINTDIRISTPDIDFSVGNSIDIGRYSILASGGIEQGNGLTLSIAGQAYSGITTVGEGAASETKGTILNHGSLELSNSPQFVSKGEIQMDQTANLTTGAGATLWTDGILTRNTGGTNTITLKGRTFVANDLKINNVGDKVVLENEYYGYGTSGSNADESSAIVINGLDTSFNMKSLKKLVIAGTAFVRLTDSSVTGVDDAGNTVTVKNPDKIDKDSPLADASDIVTGDSFAVKSNQLAYLVPTECSGVKSNPLSYADYKKLCGMDTTGVENPQSQEVIWENAKKAIINTALSKLGNKTLANYSVTTSDIVPVYSSQGFVYLYLKFPTLTAAGNYFADYYKVAGNKAQLNEYLKSYISPDSPKGTVFSSLNLQDADAIVTGGNYLINSKDSSGIAVEEQTGDLTKESLGNYASTFSQLCNSSEFTQIMNLTNLEAYMTACKDATLPATEKIIHVYKYTSNGAAIYVMEAESDSTVAAVLVDNDVPAGASTPGDYTLHVKGASTTEGSETLTIGFAGGESDVTIPAKGMLIATGSMDVQAEVNNAKYNGVIATAGRFTSSANMVLTADSDAFGKALSIHPVIGTTTYNMNALFADGGALIDDTIDNSGNSQTEYTVSDLISFENWQKN